MQNRVSLFRQGDYDYPGLYQSLKACLLPLGGMEAFVRPGQRVLLKPNFLTARAVEKAVTTHPFFILAVAELVLEAGGKPVVGDSPAVERTEKVAEKIGLTPLLAKIGVPLVSFSEAVIQEHPAGKVFKRFEVARAVTEAELIINLPKIKTHGMMALTCAVKNLFGCVSGTRKLRWHLEAGRNRDRFAEMLLDLAYLVRSALTLVDGIVGMEGEGPGNGKPRPIGVILAGADPVAIDRVVLGILGLDPTDIPTAVSAHRLGWGVPGLRAIEVIGEAIEAVRVHNFRLPARPVDPGWGLPGLVKKLLQDALSTRPMVKQERCTLCQVCVTHCPARVMSVKGERIAIDYATCIRCFCCHELCPHGAIRVGKGWLAAMTGPS